ncbi:TIR domain-containing protein [Streptosporangium sp. DT93]|uniref:TIR domain-containing protein n=1 Tax=Streptosporangium sp. DT93 TaxID=3393428 RepID=UPI003CF1A43E
MNHNHGIQISGGQVNANSMAAGPNARATTYGYEPTPEQGSRRGSTNPGVNERAVFVVHGRDSQARKSIFDLLRRMGLHPLEWESIVRDTGSGSPYLGDVVRHAFTMVQAVVVLLTPDDIVRLHPSLHENQFDREMQCQARPNVLFEAGMAFGISPERTVLVQLGQLRPFSDTGGRNYIAFDGSIESVLKLRQRLETTGCVMNDTGVDFADNEHFRDLSAYTRRPIDGDGSQR